MLIASGYVGMSRDFSGVVWRDEGAAGHELSLPTSPLVAGSLFDYFVPERETQGKSDTVEAHSSSRDGLRYVAFLIRFS